MASTGLTSLLWFCAVVALIPISLWFLKRTPLGGGAAQGLRSIAALPLSTSQRIVTVEVGHGEARRWLVLGVTPQSITVLHSMEPGADPAAAPAAGRENILPPAFAQVLRRMRREPKDPE